MEFYCWSWAAVCCKCKAPVHCPNAAASRVHRISHPCHPSLSWCTPSRCGDHAAAALRCNPGPAHAALPLKLCTPSPWPSSWCTSMWRSSSARRVASRWCCSQTSRRGQQRTSGKCWPGLGRRGSGSGGLQASGCSRLERFRQEGNDAGGIQLCTMKMAASCLYQFVLVTQLSSPSATPPACVVQAAVHRGVWQRAQRAWPRGRGPQAALQGEQAAGLRRGWSVRLLRATAQYNHAHHHGVPVW